MSLMIFRTLSKSGCYLCRSANFFFSLSPLVRYYCALIEFDSFFTQVYVEVSNLCFLSSEKKERILWDFTRDVLLSLTVKFRIKKTKLITSKTALQPVVKLIEPF